MGFEVEVPWALPEALQELAVCGELEIVAEILSLFQSDTDKRLALLRGAIHRGDRSRVRAEAHSLKGSAVQVGALALADACSEMELTAETLPSLAPLLEQIELRFAAVSRAIAQEYGAVH